MHNNSQFYADRELHISFSRIAIISDAEPARNGVGAYYEDLSEQFGAAGIDVRLFCPASGQGHSSVAMALPMPGDTSQRLCVPNPFSLNAELDNFRPDVVILPTPGVYGLTGAFLCERLGIPVLIGFHTSFEQLAKLYWQHSVMGRVVRQYFRNSNSYLFRRCAGVVANSREMQRLARRLGGRNVEIVGTLLPTDFVQAPTLRHSGRISKVLFAGRLAAEKNIEAIIEAARQLPHIEFSIAGEGPQRQVVINALRTTPNLKYLGWLSRSELRQTLDLHDALLLPSHFESFGNIALEAMARQRPAIVSTRCGIAKWKELRGGLTLIQDGSQLAGALRKLRNLDSGTLQACGSDAREAALRLNNNSLAHWCRLLEQVQHKQDMQRSA